MMAVTLQWSSIPFKSLHAMETAISYGLVGLLAHVQTFSLYLTPSHCYDRTPSECVTAKTY